MIISEFMSSHHSCLTLVCSDDHHYLYRYNHSIITLSSLALHDEYHHSLIMMITPHWGPVCVWPRLGWHWPGARLGGGCPALTGQCWPPWLPCHNITSISPPVPRLLHTVHTALTLCIYIPPSLCIKRCVFTSGEGEAHGARWVCRVCRPAKCLAPATGDHGTLQSSGRGADCQHGPSHCICHSLSLQLSLREFPSQVSPLKEEYSPAPISLPQAGGEEALALSLRRLICPLNF